jgi:hypothetical protein
LSTEQTDFSISSGNFLDLISQTFLNGSSRPALTSSSSEDDLFGVEDGAVLTTHFVDGLAGALHTALNSAALTEADAALDEANNERFNMLVKEFQRDSQFIIITHAKRTMSIADVWVGITMQIRGVSKKISVRFGEYEPEPAAVA